MRFILGKKIEMSQRFGADGAVIPVTIIEAGPCIVAQEKNIEKDGYNAVQIGFGTKKKINKPAAGHLKDLGNLRHLKEFRLENDAKIEKKRGDKIDISEFKPQDLVEVTGISKGKGFQGVVKRHHFRGHKSTHGTKDSKRMPGAIGSGGIQRVFKGMRMGGRMGGDQKTIKNLEVIEVNPEKNLLVLKGAVPGGRNSILMIKAR